MWKGQRVSVVLPAYNEQEHIGAVVAAFRQLDAVDEVVVVDNASSDATATMADASGARVVRESQRGYGFACRRALSEAQGDLIILCESDGTFLARDVHKLLAYADDFDMVLGTRTTSALIHRGANMGFALKWGNWLMAKWLELLFAGPSLTDVGCTLRLIHRHALARIQPHFRVGGSHFSPEMIIAALVCRVRLVEISVNYGPRQGTSKITGHFVGAARVALAMFGLIVHRRLRYVWNRPG